MNREDFETDLRRDGYELRHGEIPPNEHRPAHSHPWDARLLVLSGALSLVIDGVRHDYKAGDTCDVPAGTMHEEHTAATGVRLVAGRRDPSQTRAAE